MIGHHFTSETIYERYIAENGLDSKSTFETELGTVVGSWVFMFPLSGLSLLGTLIFNAVKRRTTRICHLEVEYNREDIHPFLVDQGQDEILELYHDGSLGEWVYHTDVPALVLAERIPPERVKLVRSYDLMDILKDQA